MTHFLDYNQTFDVGNYRYRLFRGGGTHGQTIAYRRLLKGDDIDKAMPEEKIEEGQHQALLPPELMDKYIVLINGSVPAND